jgi:broad specificity phosphatase PhoE
MLTLVLTRHGLTDRSRPEQHLGQKIDISINDAGRRQADALRRRLAPVAFERVITSSLFRARETAEVVVGQAGHPPIEVDPRLREMDYGAWEGRTYAQIDETDRAARREWVAHPDTLACPGGESGDDVAVRVTSFLTDLLDEHRRWMARASFRAATATGGPASPSTDHRVLVLAHGTLNRIFLCVALDVDLRRFRQRFIQSQCNLTVLAFADDAGPREGTLLVANDTSHLHGPRDVPWG